MRVMAMIKATKDSEAGSMDDAKFFAAMDKYNKQLEAAGVWKGAEGLKASSFGKRVNISKGKASVTDGPFAETKELVAGYWIWEVKSVEEAVEWARKCPTPEGEDVQVELRPLFDGQ